MKLDQPYKLIGEISPELIDNLAGSLSMIDFYADQRRTQMGNLQFTPSLVLRHSEGYINKVIDKTFQSDTWTLHDFPLMFKYRDRIDPIIEELRHHYQFEDYAVVLAMLLARKTVGRHADGGTFLESCHRLHIPLVTNPGVLYEVDGVWWHMERGKIYEIDNTRKHTCQNGGAVNRIHMILNLYPKKLEAA